MRDLARNTAAKGRTEPASHQPTLGVPIKPVVMDNGAKEEDDWVEFKSTLSGDSAAASTGALEPTDLLSTEPTPSASLHIDASVAPREVSDSGLPSTSVADEACADGSEKGGAEEENTNPSTAAEVALGTQGTELTASTTNTAAGTEYRAIVDSNKLTASGLPMPQKQAEKLGAIGALRGQGGDTHSGAPGASFGDAFHVEMPPVDLVSVPDDDNSTLSSLESTVVQTNQLISGPTDDLLDFAVVVGPEDSLSSTGKQVEETVEKEDIAASEAAASKGSGYRGVDLQGKTSAQRASATAAPADELSIVGPHTTVSTATPEGVDARGDEGGGTGSEDNTESEDEGWGSFEQPSLGEISEPAIALVDVALPVDLVTSSFSTQERIEGEGEREGEGDEQETESEDEGWGDTKQSKTTASLFSPREKIPAIKLTPMAGTPMPRCESAADRAAGSRPKADENSTRGEIIIGGESGSTEWDKMSLEKELVPPMVVVAVEGREDPAAEHEFEISEKNVWGTGGTGHEGVIGLPSESQLKPAVEKVDGDWGDLGDSGQAETIAAGAVVIPKLDIDDTAGAMERKGSVDDSVPAERLDRDEATGGGEETGGVELGSARPSAIEIGTIPINNSDTQVVGLRVPVTSPQPTTSCVEEPKDGEVEHAYGGVVEVAIVAASAENEAGKEDGKRAVPSSVTTAAAGALGTLAGGRSEAGVENATPPLEADLVCHQNSERASSRGDALVAAPTLSQPEADNSDNKGGATEHAGSVAAAAAAALAEETPQVDVFGIGAVAAVSAGKNAGTSAAAAEANLGSLDSSTMVRSGLTVTTAAAAEEVVELDLFGDVLTDRCGSSPTDPYSVEAAAMDDTAPLDALGFVGGAKGRMAGAAGSSASGAAINWGDLGDAALPETTVSGTVPPAVQPDRFAVSPNASAPDADSATPEVLLISVPPSAEKDVHQGLEEDSRSMENEAGEAVGPSLPGGKGGGVEESKGLSPGLMPSPFLETVSVTQAAETYSGVAGESKGVKELVVGDDGAAPAAQGGPEAGISSAVDLREFEQSSLQVAGGSDMLEGQAGEKVSRLENEAGESLPVVSMDNDGVAVGVSLVRSIG